MAGSWVEGRVAVVTGAAMGLGAAFADALAAAGMSVAVADVLDDVDDVAADLRARHGADARAWVTDLRRPDEVWRLVDDATAAFGGIDVLVGNAGVWASTRATDPVDPTAEAFDEVFAVNVRAVVLAARAVVPVMRARGGGHIVNVVTDHVFTEPGRPTGGGGTMDVYDASKWAINGLTLAWAAALAPTIRVNALCMGATDTPMLRSLYGPGGPPSETVAAWKRPDELGALLVALLEEGPSGRSGCNVPVWVDDPVALPPASRRWIDRVGVMKAGVG